MKICYFICWLLPNGLRSGGWAGVDSVWEQKKLEARKMLAVGAADWASEPQANIAQPKCEGAWPPQRRVHPRKSRAIILYERNRPAFAKVYSEVTSTQAVQSNGERHVRLPKCTMVSSQIDLNTGGVRVMF